MSEYCAGTPEQWANCSCTTDEPCAVADGRPPIIPCPGAATTHVPVTGTYLVVDGVAVRVEVESHLDEFRHDNKMFPERWDVAKAGTDD